MFTLFIDLGLALVAALMLLRGHYTITRQMAYVPLVVSLVDAAFAAKLQLSLTPVVSALLIALQMAILMVSVGVLREDAARARQKQARRRREEAIARNRAAIRPVEHHNNRVRQAA